MKSDSIASAKSRFSFLRVVAAAMVGAILLTTALTSENFDRVAEVELHWKSWRFGGEDAGEGCQTGNLGPLAVTKCRPGAKPQRTIYCTF